MVLERIDKGDEIPYYFLVLDAIYRSEYDGYNDENWFYTYKRIYRNPYKNQWYLLESDVESQGSWQNIIGYMERGTWPTGEILNIDTVDREKDYIQPTPRFSRGDIVNIKGDDGVWRTYYFWEYTNQDKYDAYEIQQIMPKEDGSWGYLKDATNPQYEPRYKIDASPNSLVTHLNQDYHGLQAVNPFPPTYTPKSSTPTPCGTGCSFPPYYVT